MSNKQRTPSALAGGLAEMAGGVDGITSVMGSNDQQNLKDAFVAAMRNLKADETPNGKSD